MNKRILLVDDDTDDTELFCEAVAALHSDVQCDIAVDGRDALEKLEGYKAALPDLMILDMNMPRMNGWECLKALKANERYRHIPVIVYSTSDRGYVSAIAEDLGATGFFTKPNDYQQLAGIVRKIVESLNDGSISTIGDKLHAVNG